MYLKQIRRFLKIYTTIIKSFSKSRQLASRATLTDANESTAHVG